MPPVQPSFRGSLLTGASALALSTSASGAQAQALQPQLPAMPPATWTIWGEGGPSWTGGNSFNIPSLPGLGAPYTSFSPPLGFEFAVGADYQPQGQPWHYIFDFRYGQSGTATSSSSGSSSSSSTNFVPSGFASPFSSVLLGTTTTTTTSTSSSTQASQWERHLVADLMIGRDLGVGANKPEFQVGLRVADLHAAAQAMLTGQSVTNINALTTFYSSGVIGTTSSQQTTSSGFWSAARWNSRFFGAGPRVAVTGGVPIKGSWSFEYSGGIAGLIGYRSFDMSVWNSNGSAFGATYGNNVVIFNADGFAAVSYSFTPHLKASVGIRADYYNSALRAYNVSGAGLADLDRVYWGPFVRLTGSFNP